MDQYMFDITFPKLMLSDFLGQGFRIYAWICFYWCVIYFSHYFPSLTASTTSWLLDVVFPLCGCLGFGTTASLSSLGSHSDSPRRGSDWFSNQYSVPPTPAGMDSPWRPCNTPGVPLMSSLLTVCLWACCQSLVWSESSLFFCHYKRSLNIRKRWNDIREK